jgi:hypothetical protein
MAAPPIILSKPNILVTVSDSTVNLVSQSSGWVFGYVEAIYDTCDDVTVGQRVLFKPKADNALLYGSTIYYLVNETQKLFREPIAP